MPGFRASINVSSDDVDPGEISRRIGMEPDRSVRRGDIPHPGVVPRPFHLWGKMITADSADPRFEDLETSLLAMGDELPAALGRLADEDPTAAIFLTIVQEVEDAEDHWHTGIVISDQLVRWLAVARASIDIDQYFGWE